MGPARRIYDSIREAGAVRVGTEIAFGILSIAAVVPLWVVRRPPLVDWPQHVAAIRVIHDFGDPALRFAEYFELQVGSTQYLVFYVTAHLLAYVLGPAVAAKVVASAAVTAIPWSLRALLGAVGRDDRLALLVFPLLWNAHLALGFVSFVGAVPLMLGGLALAARLRRRWSPARAVALALVAVLAFLTHVVPFGLLFVGAAAVLAGRDLAGSARRLACLVPAVLLAALWTLRSAAGVSIIDAVFRARWSDAPGPEPVYPGFRDDLAQLPTWLTDVLSGWADDLCFVFWIVIVTLLFVIAVGRRTVAGDDPPTTSPVPARLARRVAMLVPLCILAFFYAPGSYDWIWPIAGRFPILGLFLVPVLVPTPPRRASHVLLAAVALVSFVQFGLVTRAFRATAVEMGDIDAAIETIPRGSRVAGLVFEPGSEHLTHAPWVHSVAWYQAERGGAVMFTFAELPQSPFRFRDDDRPPPVGPRWEWGPRFVDPARTLGWYEYVLIRGGPGGIVTQPDAWGCIHDDGLWSVWKKR